MLDRVYLKSQYEAILIFTHRPPFTITSDTNVLFLLEFFLGWPVGTTDFLLENTVEIDISELAS
jgi:hypothetical protein